MANDWATFGSDLHLELRGTRLRAGLVDALREAVRGGRLGPGSRLPSSRSLAADLGMARNTVADAYAELVAEGWLTARQGSGTRVAERRPAPPAARPARPPRPPGPRPAHDLTPGTPDLASFPRAEWLKAYRKALAAAPNESFGYGDPRGRPELRTALAEYLARARGVHARPERIVVCSGFVHGLRLMGEVLRSRGVRDVAVESYGLDVHADLLARAGLGIPALPFDARGTRVEELTTEPGAYGKVGAVLMTAAHQFPLGGALPPDRRAAVVDWARGAGGFVLEDDYDGEFRYDRQRVGALQGLDPDRVVYLGTASKSLAPALRLGWAVVPEELVGEVVAAKEAPSALDQLAFARFLESGAYDRHVRAMRLRYRRRRDQLVAAVAAHSPRTRVSGIAAGLHAVLTLPPGTEQDVLRAAAWHGLAVQGLDRFRRPTTPSTLDGLVVGYGTPPDSAWQSALTTLCRVLP
ncbi:PLP-dependent aminotransferase family protein [Streptomyces sp. NPDC020807]|uniref:MocR-like pyridoxine biosynthesis transcription factor PdxR n=1 Tax=Streptomyces sp. NPDC020807 TaxID=3155119 RepID=UPI0033E3A028